MSIFTRTYEFERIKPKVTSTATRLQRIELNAGPKNKLKRLPTVSILIFFTVSDGLFHLFFCSKTIEARLPPKKGGLIFVYSVFNNLFKGTRKNWDLFCVI